MWFISDKCAVEGHWSVTLINPTELKAMESNCTVCLDRLKYPLGKPDNCEHKFCFKCISNWLKKRSQCPLCGGAPKHLIKIEENMKETKVPVKKRTATQFENEVVTLISMIS